MTLPKATGARESGCGDRGWTEEKPRPFRFSASILRTQLLSRVAVADFPRWITLFGDNQYNNRAWNAWLAKERPHWRVEIQSRPAGASGFAPVRKRWVVERTYAWVGRARCHSKDYERLASSSEALIQISACHLMLRRLAPTRHSPVSLPRPQTRRSRLTQQNTTNLFG